MPLNLYQRNSSNLLRPAVNKYRPLLMVLMLVYAIFLHNRSTPTAQVELVVSDNAFHLLFTFCIYLIPFLLGGIVLYLDKILSLFINNKIEASSPTHSGLSDLNQVKTNTGNEIPDMSNASSNPVILTINSFI